MVIVGSMPAQAIPVIAPFGSDTMPKAIFFTGAAKPSSSSESSTLLNRFTGEVTNATASGGNGIESGIIMTPVGDGSYVCTAAVYPGASYSYFFAYRIGQYDIGGAGLDSRTTWTNWRTQSENRTVADKGVSRSITIPASATSGYYIYNAFLDRSVIGYQGTDSNVLTTLNPFLANFGGRDTIGGINRTGVDTYSRISNVSDTLFANMDVDYNGNGKVYNLDAVQTGDNSYLVSWGYEGNGNSGAYGKFQPTVDGARYFTDGGYGSTARYGYRIYRGDSLGVYSDITASVTGGDTNWADNSTNDPWGGTSSFTDTSKSINIGDTLTYTVLWYNAYGYNNTNLVPQFAWSGGNDSVAKGNAIRVFFIVEHYNENAVFKNGSNQGRAYLTPYIDGVRHPEMRMPADVIRVVPRRGDIS